MSKYRERVDVADFPGRVAKLRDQLNSLSAASRQGIANHGEPDLLERLERVLDHLLVVVSSTPPEVVTTRFLKASTELLDSVFGALEQVEVDPTEGEVVALASSVEDLADDLLSWPAGAGEKEVTQAASTYRRSLGQQLVSARDELRDLETEISDLKAAVASARHDNQAALEETAETGRVAVNDLEQRVAVLSTRVETLDQQAESALARTTSTIDRFEEQFLSAQADRTKAHETLTVTHSSGFTAALRALEEKAQTGLDAINENVAESGDLVTLFASAGTGNAYSTEADTQAEQADLWRLVTVSCAVLVVGLSALVLFIDGTEDNIGIIAGRLALAIALGGVSAYAARQSARHRHREEVARRLALDIVAFGPFTKDLDETKQDDARLELSRRIFGPDSLNGSSARLHGLNDGHINLLSRIFDLITKTK